MPFPIGGRLGRRHPLRPDALINNSDRIPNVLNRSFFLRILRITASIVLLILAAAVDSPLHPGRKQTVPSSTCRSPWWFETWMALSAALLGLFTCASTWKRYRDKQKKQRLGAGYALPVDIDLEAHPHRNTPPLPPPGELAAAADTAEPPIPRAQSVPNLLPTPLPPAQMRQVHHSQSISALHSQSTPALLSPSTPALLSPSSTETLTLVASNSKPSKATAPTSPWLPSSSSSVASTPAPSIRAASTSTIPQLTPALPLIPPITTPEPSIVSTRNPSVLSLATHQQPLDVGPAPPSFAPSRLRALRFAKMYSRFDKLADFVDSLYFARFALFIIGHAILFTPSPKEETTCYHSAPFLWWGVFVGLLYDWARIATWILIAFVAVILMAKSLAAHLYNLFAIRMGWREPPPPPVPPTPAPSPLTSAELLRCKIVCYVPDPEDPASEDGHSVMDGDAILPGEIDLSRLPFPGLVLPAHRATCGVCQENFKAPREVTTRIMYKVAELRQLPCDHVFHQACVDEWLNNHSDSCPYCTQSVRDGLKRVEEEVRSAAASRVSLAMGGSGTASQTSLPMAMASRNTSRVSLGGSRNASRLSLGSRNASRASLGISNSSTPPVAYSASASPTSLPMLNSQAAASQTSLAEGSAFRYSSPYPPPAQASSSARRSVHSLYSPPHASSHRNSLPAASQNTKNSPYSLPLTTSRNSLRLNAASGSRISLGYIHPAALSRTSLTCPTSPPTDTVPAPSPTMTPTLGARQITQYQYPSRASLSATASRTSLVPVPENATPGADGDVPPVPSIPPKLDVGHAL